MSQVYLVCWWSHDRFLLHFSRILFWFIVLVLTWKCFGTSLQNFILIFLCWCTHDSVLLQVCRILFWFIVLVLTQVEWRPITSNILPQYFPQIGATMTLNCQIEKWKDQHKIQHQSLIYYWNEKIKYNIKAELTIEIKRSSNTISKIAGQNRKKS